MKKIILLLIFFLGVLSLSYYGFVRFTRPTNPLYQTKNLKQEETSELINALKTGKNTICERIQDDIKTEYVINGNKIRTKTTSSSETAAANWVNDGKSIYIWSDGQTQGVQINYFEEDTNINNDPTENQETNFSSLLSGEYEIKCHPSEGNDSEFIPPSTINFTILRG